MQSPEELGGDHVLVSLPAQLAEGFAHDALGLAAGVRLGVVEEVDARLFGGVQTLGGLLARLDLVGVGEGDPTAK